MYESTFCATIALLMAIVALVKFDKLRRRRLAVDYVRNMASSPKIIYKKV